MCTAGSLWRRASMYEAVLDLNDDCCTLVAQDLTWPGSLLGTRRCNTSISESSSLLQQSFCSALFVLSVLSVSPDFCCNDSAQNLTCCGLLSGTRRASITGMSTSSRIDVFRLDTGWSFLYLGRLVLVVRPLCAGDVMSSVSESARLRGGTDNGGCAVLCEGLVLCLIAARKGLAWP
jgi:hypothetical protein